MFSEFFIILKGRSFIEIVGVVLLQFSSEHFDVGDGYFSPEKISLYKYIYR